MLKILGAGFSRTGTSSLKRALEILELGPCYHMHEVFLNPENPKAWTEAMTNTANWQELFRGYQSAVDAPTCHFWQQIHDAFQSSKVILTERDPDEWYESYYSTIFQVLSNPSLMASSARATLEMVRKLELDHIFTGRFEDKAHAITIYTQHNQQVKNTLSSENLLVFNVSDGWEPLCTFLDIDIPDVDFPYRNSQAQFQSRVGFS